MVRVRSIARKLSLVVGLAAVCALALFVVSSLVSAASRHSGNTIAEHSVIEYLHRQIDGASWIECDDVPDARPGGHADCSVTLSSGRRRVRVTVLSVRETRGREAFVRYDWAWLDDP